MGMSFLRPLKMVWFSTFGFLLKPPSPKTHLDDIFGDLSLEVIRRPYTPPERAELFRRPTSQSPSVFFLPFVCSFFFLFFFFGGGLGDFCLVFAGFQPYFWEFKAFSFGASMFTFGRAVGQSSDLLGAGCLALYP